MYIYKTETMSAMFKDCRQNFTATTYSWLSD